MKYLAAAFLLICALPISSAKTYFGSVVYVASSPDEVTVAADSRRIATTGEREDTECKISAFGDRFVFVAVGVAGGTGWSASSIARETWEDESKSTTDAETLVRLVSDKWTEKMEEIAKRPAVIASIRKHTTSEPVVSQGIFSATDPSGNLAIRDTEITFDLRLYDSTGTAHMFHQGMDVPQDASLTGGHDEVIREFQFQTSSRSKEYMAWFLPQLPAQPSDRNSRLASKYVELSILLHPDNAELGFPIDVLQLRRRAGVHWVSLKPGCPQS